MHIPMMTTQTCTLGWLRNSIPGNSIDGGTIVMLSQMLKQNISIIGWDQIWNCLDAATDIGIMYGRDNKFVATEVSGMLTYNSTVIVCILYFKLYMNLNVCILIWNFNCCQLYFNILYLWLVYFRQ